MRPDNPDAEQYDELPRRLQENQQEVDIKTPLFSGSFKGTSQQVLTILLVCAIAGLIAYQIYTHEQTTKERVIGFTMKLEEHKKDMQVLHGSVKTLIYVTALSEKERAKLNLTKPKELRDMERE